MTLTVPQLLAIGAAVGFAARLAERMWQFVEGVLVGAMVGYANRRTLALRMRQKHCAHCANPMTWYCPTCGHFDAPES